MSLDNCLSAGPFQPESIEEAAKLIVEAFTCFSDRYNNYNDFSEVEPTEKFVKCCLESAQNCSGQIIYTDPENQSKILVGVVMADCYDHVVGINALVVKPSHHNRGIAKKLIALGTDLAFAKRGKSYFREIKLTAETFNIISISVYHSLGFDLEEDLRKQTHKPGPMSLDNCLSAGPFQPESIEEAAKLIVEAFTCFSDRYNNYNDFSEVEPTEKFVKCCLESAQNCSGQIIYTDPENQSKILVGVVMADCYDHVVGINALVVKPSHHNRGIAKKLIALGTDLAFAKRGKSYFREIKLTAETFNIISISVYHSLGFDLEEDLQTYGPRPGVTPVEKEVSDQYLLRKMVVEDIPECCQLMKKLMGFSREEHLIDTLQIHQRSNGSLDGDDRQVMIPHALLEKSTNQIVAFTTGFSFGGLSLASTDAQLFELMQQHRIINNSIPPLFLGLGRRDPGVMRWLCSAAGGMRLTKGLFIMCKKLDGGEGSLDVAFADSKGVYLPTIIW
eukprot:TRINITY_DN6458_c0_g1_i1.p1 TRINITY_DN6458_c0_g1~~TRINITY_DN6458_c0_g1_i1.p1  ORF type:complete len:519 (+),score=163.27 TRINITY_DN6458_c0_g1_i1:50-1558(+)